MGTGKESWIPSFGEFDDWKDYCDSLYFLYHGNLEPYMEAYQRLLNCEMRSGKEEKESIIQKMEAFCNEEKSDEKVDPTKYTVLL